MSSHHRVRLLIIGSGPAGYTAAIYAARANLHPVLVQGLQPGGQLTITTEVENYPGAFPAPHGPELMDTMREQAMHCGARLDYDIVTSVDFSQRPFVCGTDSGAQYVADAVIVATGAQARWLGLESETRLQGRGVSGCATCDGFFYRGKHVLVVGGGNTAVEEALYLSGLCAQVTLVHRRGSFRAEPVLQERVAGRANISVIWHTEIAEILGESSVTGARLSRTDTGVVSEIACDGVFIAIGHVPAISLFQGQMEMDSNGYLRIAPWSTQAYGADGQVLAGVFAAGDVADSRYRQAVTAAGMGCMAALEAQRFLEAG